VLVDAYHVFSKTELDRAIRTDRYPLSACKKAGTRAETVEHLLYDCQTVPKETSKLAAELPTIVEQLRAIMMKIPQPVVPVELRSAKR